MATRTPHKTKKAAKQFWVIAGPVGGSAVAGTPTVEKALTQKQKNENRKVPKISLRMQSPDFAVRNAGVHSARRV